MLIFVSFFEDYFTESGIKQLYDGSFLGNGEMILHSLSNVLEIYQLADSVDELCCGMFTFIILCQICIPDEKNYYEHFNQLIDMFFFLR